MTIPREQAERITTVLVNIITAIVCDETNGHAH